MNLSRVKPVVIGNDPVNKIKKEKTLKLEDYLDKGDYLGALTLLEFQHNTSERGVDADLWLAYCAFHLGEYKRAMEEYKAMTMNSECTSDVWIYLACTLFYLGLYKEAEEAALKAPKSQLQNRLLLHLAHKFRDEKRLMVYHQSLENVIEDQMGLASIHYLRCHYREAIDVYQQILLRNRDYLALYVYIALCYYKMEYYEISQQVLAIYLQRFPHSPTALNLEACILFKLYSGRAVEIEAELRHLLDMSSTFESAKELIRHNLALFRGGVGALQVLPGLLDVIPEARLNLAIYHLRQEDLQLSYALIKDLELNIPHEYILKGVVNALLGQEAGSMEHIITAQELFQLVGSAASECDTIAGRQCLASAFFLRRRFKDVLIYLNSIKNYFFNDDTFNFNYAQAKAAIGNYREAEEALLLIQSDELKRDYVYLSWLARCYIMNRKAGLAWELYLNMGTSADSYCLLQLIANDCYKMGQFYHAAKAFYALERLDPIPEYKEGKRGACVGVFQLILAGRESREMLKKVLPLLRDREHPGVEHILRTVKKWAKDNKVAL